MEYTATKKQRTRCGYPPEAVDAPVVNHVFEASLPPVITPPVVTVRRDNSLDLRVHAFW